MKKYNYCLASLLALGMALSSCEDRLDIEKHGNMGSIETFYKTELDAEQAIAATYNFWQQGYGSFMRMLDDLSDDVWTGGCDRGDQPYLEQLNEYVYDTNNKFVEDSYTYLYQVIYYANLVIAHVPGDTPAMKRCIAEALFLRSWANFYLGALWGTPPLVDHPLDVSEYQMPNSEPGALWAQAVTDLKLAIPDLPSKANKDDKETSHRITKEAAKTWLGKVYLWQGNAKDAADQFEEGITSGKYDLYRGDFGDIPHAICNNDAEQVLESQLWNDPNLLWSAGWAMSNMSYNCFIGYRTGKMTLSAEASSWVAPGTYGFYNPRKSLYEAFVAEEGVDGYRLNQSIITSKQMAEKGITLNEGESLPGQEGFYWWKFRQILDDLMYSNAGFQVTQFTTQRHTRYAEVLLLAAEAQLAIGNEEKARGYVNAIRNRAHLQDKTHITLDDIKLEKRLELCCESVRYMDLIRWGDAQTVLAEQGKNVYWIKSLGGGDISVDLQVKNNTNAGFKEKHKLLPIPLKEMEVNPNAVQNPGW